MANEEQLARLKRGVAEWNAWRSKHRGEDVNLQGADLFKVDLRGADLRMARLREAYLSDANLLGANLVGASLSKADLTGADLTGTDLSKADLVGANLSRANFSRADLVGANLSEANLVGANLSRANLSEADLVGANLSRANLSGTVFHKAYTGQTIFANVYLQQAKGLNSIEHYGPSTVGIDTLIASGGHIPEAFLRGCGVPDNWITYFPSLIGSLQPIQYYSCFISYSTKDEAFAQRLHGRLQQEHVRVWYAPHDLKIDKLYPQIDEAIRVHDKLLLILSSESMRSNWVETELRLALAKEHAQGCRVLFPVRLTEYDALVPWRCFDSDTGRDLAADVRSYYIGDFSNWKDHDTFETSFARLLNDLKANDAMLPKL